MSTKITFNGVEYESLEEMPPEARKTYQRLMGLFDDANKDGTPDLFGLEGKTHVTTTTHTYTDPSQMPPQIRGCSRICNKTRRSPARNGW